jgi:Tfp pilus assembly protein FimT
MKKPCAAFSLVEMLILAIFVGILAMISVPRINLGVIDKQRVDTAAHKLMTDLRRTRHLAISDAATNTTGYGLVLQGASPYTGYEIWDRKSVARVDSHTFDSCISCTADGKNFNFGPTGNLLTGGGTKIKMASRGRSFVITVIPATGMVKCAEE